MKKKSISIISLMFVAILLASCSSKLPSYDEKKSVGSQINYTITGIDAGAGIMSSTQKAIDKYNLKDDNWQLQTSSTAAMTSTLDKALQDKRPIVITGWQPHWMFTKYKIKFLKDPKNVYGEAENIHTIARVGLQKDEPSAYQVLDRFHWTKEQMSEVMLQVNNGKEPEAAAKEWMKKNQNQVNSWTKDVKKVKNHKIKLTYVAWDSEIASTNVVAQTLKSIGYDVTIQAMEIQPMWSSIATNAADAQVCAWLPKTSGIFYKDFKGKYVDLGVNLKGARVGLAVPDYMKNINSIEDLKNN